MRHLPGVLTLAALLVAATVPHASAQVTRPEHIACLKKEWLKDMQRFMTKRDTARFRNYIENRRCILLDAGVKVEILDSPGLFGDTFEFRYRGTRYWTDSTGIDPKGGE